MYIINKLKSKIEDACIEDSIDFAYYLGEVLFYNEIPLFDLSLIEDNLIARVLRCTEFYFEMPPDVNTFLFVVSQPYITGGHTRLMENLSLMIDERRNLLITRGANVGIKERLTNYFSKVNECYRQKNEKSIAFIIRLVNEITQYEKIVLNPHPEDIFTIIACGIAKKLNKDLNMYFVNHADHAFSYGASIADFWFEISLYGHETDNLRNIKGKRSFIGIPINKPDDYFFEQIIYPKLEDITNFVTAASATKYKPYKNSSILSLLDSVLREREDIKIDVIGVNMFWNYWWWPLKLRFFNRLKLHRSLPYEEYMNVTSKADCYIDSYPVPGGTAFVEQFLQGIPCIGLRSDFFGYTPLEKIKKNTVAEIIEMLKKPPNQEDMEGIQNLVFKVHGFSQVKNRFLGTINDGGVFHNPMENHLEIKKLRDDRKEKVALSSGFIDFLFKFDRELFWEIIYKTDMSAIIKLPLSKVYYFFKASFKKIKCFTEN